MKLSINTSRYDGVVTDNGYENSDVNNDGRTMFEYGWAPGDALRPVLGLGNGTRSRGVSGIDDWSVVSDGGGNTYYIDGEGNAVAAMDADGNYIEAVATANSVPPDSQSPNKPSGVATQTWLDVLTAKAPQIIAGINAYQMSQVNIDRARRGLPAINAAAYGPQIGVGLTGGTSNLLLYGAIGIAAVMLLKK